MNEPALVRKGVPMGARRDGRVVSYSPGRGHVDAVVPPAETGGSRPGGDACRIESKWKPLIQRDLESPAVEERECCGEWPGGPIERSPT